MSKALADAHALYEVLFHHWRGKVIARAKEVRWHRMSPKKAAMYNTTDLVLVNGAFAELEAARLAEVLAGLTFRAERWPLLRRACSVVLL